jgi:uncharacterized membrane protein
MSNYPPPGGYQGGYQGGGYPPPSGKTKTLNLDYNVAALLCYVPVCCIHFIASLLFFFTEPKESRLVRFHALQSLLFTGVLIVVYIVLWIVGIGAVIGSSTDPSGAAGAGASILLTLVFWGLALVVLILYIVLMIKAYQGQMWKLPIIGNIAEKSA